MSRLLWLSDSPTCPTGQGTVTRHVLKQLHATRRYQILARGWGYGGEAYDGRAFPYEIQPALPGPADRSAMTDALRQFRPDLVVTYADPWRLEWIAALPCLSRWIGYYPLDAAPLTGASVRVIRQTAIPVATCEYGAGLMREDSPHKPVEVIYHGVDTHVFRPLRGPEQVERIHLGEFVVGFVGRNQPRKGLPILLSAFARFAQEREEVFLYLHTAANDAGWNVPALLDEYGIAERAAISERATAAEGVPDEEMNEIYNCMDIFVLPSNGEGFGLPLLEAMAAGVPVVTTDTAAGHELVEGRGELIRVASLQPNAEGVLVAKANENHLLEILEKLYGDARAREQYGRLGRKFSEQWTWERIGAQWDALFQRALGGGGCPDAAAHPPDGRSGKAKPPARKQGPRPKRGAPKDAWR